MNKKSFFYMTLCILVLITCNLAVAEDASSFKVSLNPVTSSISAYGQAVYEMRITNMNSYEDKFRIYYSDVLWDFHTEPRTDSSVMIKPYETRTITLVFKPNNLALGTYAIPISVRGQKDSVLQSASAFVSIRSPDQLVDTYYNTAIDMELLMEDKIDPRKEIQINVDLINLNPKNNTGLVVVIESDMFRDQKYTSLAPMEKKRLAFRQSIGPLEKPGRHFVDAYIMMEQPNNKTILIAKIDKPKVFDVVEYGSLTKNESTSKSLLKRVDTIVVKNDGNFRKDEILKFETGLIKRMFQKTSPESSEMKEDDKRYYGFEVGLEPSQSITITITTNYRILLWISILIVVCIVLYFALRSPIVITKSYSNVTLKEGGISELKVMIHLKNRSIKARDNVGIIDLVPHIAEVEKDFPVGSLHPNSIFRHEKKGTVVKWNLDSLDGFEERIISYNIKSRLSILGGFRLPVARAKFRQFGRVRVAKSNRVLSKV